MRLEQRNAGRLEGKVVVYGRCDDALEERILGFYLTSDLDELTKKTGSASATEVVEEALNKWYVQKSDDPTDVMVLYACAIAGPSIEAVAQRTCDGRGSSVCATDGQARGQAHGDRYRQLPIRGGRGAAARAAPDDRAAG